MKHGTTTVTPDKPKTANDKLPDNPTKSYPEGVAENNLNKTVTRTINVTTPDGKTSTITQTVHLTRTATVDEVTGDVTYSDCLQVHLIAMMYQRLKDIHLLNLKLIQLP